MTRYAALLLALCMAAPCVGQSVPIKSNFAPQAPVVLVTAAGRMRPFGVGASTASARGTALISAVDAMTTVGDKVLIGPGTFTMPSAIVLDVDGTSIEGSGPTTILDFDTNNIVSMSIRLYADNLTVGNFNATFNDAAYSGIGYLVTEPGYPASHAANGFLIHDIVTTNGSDQIMFWETPATAFTGTVRDVVINQPNALADPAVHLVGAAGADLVFDNVTVVSASGVSVLMEGTGGTLTMKNSRVNETLAQDGSTTILVDGTTRYDATLAAGTITKARMLGVTPGATGIALLDDATASAARDTLGASSGVFPLSVGGLGATTASGARDTLGATSGVFPIAAGGTGASTAAGARTALDVGKNWMSMEQTQASSPADATTYYIYPNFLLTSETGATRFYPPTAGTITRARVQVGVQGVNGTTESVAVYLRKNATTDYALTTTMTYDSTFNTVNATGLSIPVTDGDYFTVKIVCPTWATNPTNVTHRVDIEVTK